MSAFLTHCGRRAQSTIGSRSGPMSDDCLQCSTETNEACPSIALKVVCGPKTLQAHCEEETKSTNDVVSNAPAACHLQSGNCDADATSRSCRVTALLLVPEQKTTNATKLCSTALQMRSSRIRPPVSRTRSKILPRLYTVGRNTRADRRETADSKSSMC